MLDKDFTICKDKGFTLVEIMIVVAIVALLASLAIPGLLRARISGNETYAQASLKTISNACETYAAANNGQYPIAIADLIAATPPYLNEDYTDATRKGYDFACSVMAITGYSCTATPSACNQTGTKTFTISTGGIFNSMNCS